ncbi:MAG: Lrp/AsnC ligand binding domain-containing protein [Candidatus Aminicenantia bacterium]
MAGQKPQKAFVFLNSETGKDGKILKKIRKMKGVKWAYLVYGVYDLIVCIDFENIDELKRTIMKDIRAIDGVRSILTTIVID